MHTPVIALYHIGKIQGTWKVLFGQLSKEEWEHLGGGGNMGFDLRALIKPIPALDILTKPFTTKEIDDVVKHMPIDKAPGPDGFNGLFLKKCWPIICKDFYTLAHEFYEERAQVANLNASYITLIP